MKRNKTGGGGGGVIFKKAKLVIPNFMAGIKLLKKYQSLHSIKARTKVVTSVCLINTQQSQDE